MSNLLGIDIYHGDYDDGMDFHALAAGGVKFIWHKATEGVSEIDPMYAQARPRAKSVAVPLGAYHFLTTDDPVQQAQHFINHASPASGDLIPWLDTETLFPGVGAATYACALEIKRLCGHCPIIYASDSFWQSYLAAHFDDNWARCIARYPGPPNTACQFHQFSETYRIDGIPHDLDADYFLGSDLTPYII